MRTQRPSTQYARVASNPTTCALSTDDLIRLLKEYNLSDKSVKSFSDLYHLDRKTATKYLRMHNIFYRSNGVVTMPKRNVNGRFLLGTSKHNGSKSQNETLRGEAHPGSQTESAQAPKRRMGRPHSGLGLRCASVENTAASPRGVRPLLTKDVPRVDVNAFNKLSAEEKSKHIKKSLKK